MSLLLAIDPGSSLCGYACVSPEGPRVRFVAAGQFEAGAEALLHLVDWTSTMLGISDLAGITTLAVETPSGWVHDAVRGKHLLATAVAAGEARGVGRARGLRVVSLSAGEVRKALVGKTRVGFRQRKGDMDRAVEAAIRPFVLDLPKRTNVHVRDALAIAIVANWMTGARGRARKEAV